MSRFGGLSEERPSVFKTRSKLGGLNTPANRLKTFVDNRVAKVQELTEGFQWNHVPSVLNPADLVSRGLRPCYLPYLRLRWQGPQFLEKGKLSSEETSLSPVKDCEYSKELKTGSSSDIITSSVCVSTNCVSSILSTLLRKNSDGLLRVVGRLSNSDSPYVNKHPAILPGNHNLTVQVIVHFHRKNLYTGASSLLHYVREKFWPLNGRSLCRKVVHECLVCLKSQPLVTSQLMGNLPRDRVVPDYPFNCSGVDFCGPFMIRYKNQRKGILHKIYICVFVCFVSKAIPIEIVSDHTSDAFIATLKRVFSRRGKCAKLYSDNGKTFVGANKELKRFLKLIEDSDDNLAGFLSAEGIEWKFIPPRAPSFGGLWEALVKSIKYHLKRVVSGANLTYEEFLTVCIQIEGILNSRPLCPLSSNSDDLNALTPAHFLIGRSMTSVVEPNLIQLKENALKKWQRITRLVQLIWNKWHRCYLSELQQRNKWQFKKQNVKVGDLVVLIEDNMPTFKWPLGRITEIYSGSDALIRVVKVKTQFGEYKRAISRVCLLPMPVEFCL
ncbi:integrase catalytic domain-containing protein [Trichonephila clavipes]|nr:integrase catalytic domain-containing protein [Trichonephila clavipes]